MGGTSAFHNVTAMVGAGVLSLPYAMVKPGMGTRRGRDGHIFGSHFVHSSGKWWKCTKWCPANVSNRAFLDSLEVSPFRPQHNTFFHLPLENLGRFGSLGGGSAFNRPQSSTFMYSPSCFQGLLPPPIKTCLSHLASVPGWLKSGRAKQSAAGCCADSLPGISSIVLDFIP
nr:lysine histidine transporter 1-like [Ipomoea batatas]